VKNEEDLLLFFKYLFGKPSTICNLPHFRKVLDVLWQRQVFESFDYQKIADNLRQWASGI
jgi:hypothetical protein